MAFERFGWGQENQVASYLARAIHRTFFLTLTLVLGTISPASASTAANWQLTPTPASATQINGFAIDQNNYWYIADRNTGFWISKNQGTSWTQINSGLPNTCGGHIQFNPHNKSIVGSLDPSNCSQTGNTHWYTTTNQGTNWTRIPEPTGFAVKDDAQTAGLMPPVSGGTMLLGGVGAGGAACMYSQNDGATTYPCAGALATIRGFGHGAGNTLVIGGENGGYQQSTNNGANFATVWPFQTSPSNGEIVSVFPSCNGPLLLADLSGVWQATGTSPNYIFSLIYNLSQRARVLYQDSSCNLYLGQRQLNQNPTVLKCSFTSGTMQCSEWDAGIGTGLEAHEFVENAQNGAICTVIENGSTNAGWVYCTANSSTGGGTSSSSTGGQTSSSSSSSGTSSTSGRPPSSSSGGQTTTTSSSSGQTSGTSTSIHGGSSVTGATTLTMQVSLPQLARIGAQYYGSVSASGGVVPYRYFLDASSLPPGLVLNSSTGAITGTPTTIGKFNFKVAATDSTGAKHAAQGQIYVLYPSSGNGSGSNSVISVSVSPTSATVASGRTQQFTVQVSGTANTAVSWSASAGTINSSGLFTAPTVTSNTSVTVTATSAANSAQRATATITVNAPAAISVAVSPSTATVSSGSTQQFTATVQGTSNTAVTWSATAGSVSNGGMFTAPTVSASTSVSVTATSAANSTTKASASVAVTPYSTLSITTTFLSAGLSGAVYSFPMLASGGSTPYQWSITAGSLPLGFALSGAGQLAGTTTQTGQFSFTVTVRDSANNTTSKSFALAISAPPSATSSGVPGNEYCGKSGGTDGPAQLPVTYFCTDLAHTPAPGPTVNVPAGASLQNAVNSAACGTNITVQGGATFTLNYLPQKNCDPQHWIIIRPDPASEAALPPEGHRAAWCYSGVAALPGRPTEHCPATPVNAMWKLAVTQPVQIQGNGYRLIGFEAYQAAGGTNYNLFITTAGIQYLVLDRYWMHGTPTTELVEPIGFTGTSYVAAVDGALTDFHCQGNICGESHGFSAVSGPGVYKVVDNYIEVGGIGVFFGGGSNQYGTPCDIEVRGNEFFRPWSWMPGIAAYGGIPWQVKNFVESKNACRELIEGNHFDHVWGGYSQNGSAVLVTPKNQSAGTQNICPTCQVTDYVFRYNAGDSVGATYQIANASSDAGGYAQAGNSYSFHDNLWTNIGYSTCFQCGSYDMELFTGLSAPASDYLGNVSIDHDTHVFASDMSRSMMTVGGLYSPPVQSGMSITNSILPAGPYAINSVTGADCSATGVAGGPLGRLNACWTSPYQFAGNIVPNGMGSIHQANNWPAGNHFPADQASVGFNSLTSADYSLAPGSMGYQAGTDGRDIGADIPQVMALGGAAQ